MIKEINEAKLIDKFSINQVILKGGFVGAQCSAKKVSYTKV
ncbi:hypothetical protein [Clostridium weizhouense]|nr:hypothetical protein [Clostridium weizhouense]